MESCCRHRWTDCVQAKIWIVVTVCIRSLTIVSALKVNNKRDEPEKKTSSCVSYDDNFKACAHNNDKTTFAMKLIIWLRWIWRFLSPFHFATHKVIAMARLVFVCLFLCSAIFLSFVCDFSWQFLLFAPSFVLCGVVVKIRFKCLILRYVEHSICYFVLPFLSFNIFVFFGAVNPSSLWNLLCRLKRNFGALTKSSDKWRRWNWWL